MSGEAANVFAPSLEEERERPRFRCRSTMLGPLTGAERLGASIYEIDPGESSAPYHWHSANEELLIVLRGHPSLRTADGWRELAEGEVVAFPRGEAGVHQLANRGDETARFVIFSEMHDPEVVVYPDSDKVGARSWAHGIRRFFRTGDAVEYWEGESYP